jgi:hypothetical protein
MGTPTMKTWADVKTIDDLVPDIEKPVIKDAEERLKVRCPHLKKKGEFFYYCSGDIPENTQLKFEPLNPFIKAHQEVLQLQLHCMSRYKACCHYTGKLAFPGKPFEHVAFKDQLEEKTVNELTELYDGRLAAGVPESALIAAMQKSSASKQHNLYEKQVPPVVQKVEDILASDPEYYTIVSNEFFPNRDELFIFGEKTIKGLMKLTYGCKRCGLCCENQLGEQCKNLTDLEAEIKTCSLWGKSEFPLQCAIFPFCINTDVSKGMGTKYINLRARKELSASYSFGVMDYLIVGISPHNSGYLNPNGQTLGELYEKAKEKIVKWTGPTMPPNFTPDTEAEYTFYMEQVRAALSSK